MTVDDKVRMAPALEQAPDDALRAMVATIEALARIHVFAAVNPATGQPGCEHARAALGEALGRLREFASAELLGRDLSRAELRRRDQLIERLRSRHMRRIVAIARAQIEPILIANGLPEDFLARSRRRCHNSAPPSRQ